MPEASYEDYKGRTRWYRNDEIACVVKQLGDYLIIGGYPEEHAKRYAQLANTISRWPDPVDQLEKTGTLEKLPGVGGVITGYLTQIIRTGTTDKFKDDQYGKLPPLSVLELTQIERLGAKTARMLYQQQGINSLASLCAALDNHRLDNVKGIGPAMKKTIAACCEQCQRL